MVDFLILTPWFPNQPDGWPARYISDSALALSELGHTVRIGVVRGFVPYGLSKMAPVEHRGNVDVTLFKGIEDIREARYFALPRGLMPRTKNKNIDRAVRELLTDFVIERRPDIVLVHTETIAPSAVKAAGELGLPVTVTLHGENTNRAYLAPNGQHNRFYDGLSQADRILVVGSSLKPYAAALSGRSDNIDVIWNGVTPPARQRRIPKPDVKDIELVTVANLQEGKGIDLLLKALARLKSEGVENWNLKIVGQGPMRKELQAILDMERLTLKVTFLGALSNTDVFNVLADADVFILPSYREAFGVVYLEAMASGLLTIGVAGQGPDQFIQNENTGFLIEPKSIDAIVFHLRTIVTGDRRKWREIATRGSLFVRSQMTWDSHARRLSSIAKDIIASKTLCQEKPEKILKQLDALALFIEPAPYIRNLERELKRQWPGKVTTRYTSASVSQGWQGINNEIRKKTLPNGAVFGMLSLWHVIRSQRPKIVFVAGWGHPLIIATIFMAKIAGARIISMSDTWQSNSNAFRNIGKCITLRLIDRFTPGGKRQEKHLRDLGIPEQHIFRGNMTVDTNAIKAFLDESGARYRRAFRQELGADERCTVFLFVGRLEPIKGIDLLLNAFIDLDPMTDTRLVIVGEGSLRPKVEDSASRDPRISYHGRLEGQPLWAQFAAADVLIAPSLAEPWGLVVNEALAAKLAIVLSDTHGCIDDLITPNENAIIFPAGDQGALTQALRRLSSNRQLLEKLRGAASRSIEGWTTEAWAKNILIAWQNATSAREDS